MESFWVEVMGVPTQSDPMGSLTHLDENANVVLSSCAEKASVA